MTEHFSDCLVVKERRQPTAGPAHRGQHRRNKARRTAAGLWPSATGQRRRSYHPSPDVAEGLVPVCFSLRRYRRGVTALQSRTDTSSRGEHASLVFGLRGLDLRSGNSIWICGGGGPVSRRREPASTKPRQSPQHNERPGSPKGQYSTTCATQLVDVGLHIGDTQAPRETVSVQALRNARLVEGLRMDGNQPPISPRGLYSRPGTETASPTKWVTREHPKIDRIACPWLIRRFIDPNAEFIYVPTSRLLAVALEVGGTPYDIEGVEFSHEGDRCSFDTFLRIYEIKVPALDHLATIVRGADTSRHDLAPQCAGCFRSRSAYPPISQTTMKCWSTAWSSMTRSTRGAVVCRGRPTTGRQSPDRELRRYACVGF